MGLKKHDKELEQDASDDKGAETLELQSLKRKWHEAKNLLRHPRVPGRKRPCTCKECRRAKRSIKENFQFLKKILRTRSTWKVLQEMRWTISCDDIHEHIHLLISHRL